MSLNYNLAQIADHETACFTTDRDGNRVMRPETEVIIWTIFAATGHGKITARNVDEVADRYAVYQRLFGPLLRRHVEGGGFEDVPLTRDQIVAHVGLTTNWTFKGETEATWRKRTMDNALREARHRRWADAHNR